MGSLISRIKAWFTGKPAPEDDLDTTEITYEQSHDADYWRRRDAFTRDTRRDPPKPRFGPDKWGF